MAETTFTDHSDETISAINDAIISGLYECAGELESQAQKNTRVDTGQLKGAWDYTIDEKNLTATVGNTMQNAIWEEFGTGEYAQNNDGRSGYWVYVKHSGTDKTTSKSTKTYTLEEAKRIMAFLREQGLEAYYTKGKKGSKALQNAVSTVRPKINSVMASKLKGMG